MDGSKRIGALTRRAEAGDLHSQCLLADLYLDSDQKSDLLQAIKWLRVAAEAEDAWAQYMLGYLYQSGNGVRKSIARATYWYELSARQGYDSAQLNLGIIYANRCDVRAVRRQAALRSCVDEPPNISGCGDLL